MDSIPSEKNETLDPQDWDEIRALGHRMVDDMLDYLQTVRSRPVWQPVPDDVKEQLRQALPLEPQDPAEIYQEFLDHVLPYPMGNIHPRFWGWVIGTGTPLGMLAEMLAAGMNPNVGGGDHIAPYVELQVIDWCKQMMSFPTEASGLLVSGGSMANLVGLTVARNIRAGYDVRAQGVQAAPQPMAVYGSREMHSSIDKAVELLGLGQAGLRKIPVNTEFQIDLEALVQTLAADREAGILPICIVGNAGTVNTGAVDDLNALADLCAREGIWFHVDGAFGAIAALSPEHRSLVSGLERADSLAFDLHKWMYMPYEVGCTLVRRSEEHLNAFTLTPGYLAHAERGLAAGSHWFSDYGIQLSRGFRALKVWMSIKEHGLQKYGRLVAQNIRQAHHLANLVDARPELECLAPVPLNIVCFRYNPGGLDIAALNRFNQELLIRLHESGIAAPSYTTLNGSYALRVCITNHRTRFDDLDVLVDAVVRLGKELQAEMEKTGSAPNLPSG